MTAASKASESGHIGVAAKFVPFFLHRFFAPPSDEGKCKNWDFEFPISWTKKVGTAQNTSCTITTKTSNITAHAIQFGP